MVASLVLPPALMFTELRTITDVTGNPPISPAAMLPTPWAISSRLGGEIRFCGSSLSTASRFKSVSSEATRAMVTAAMNTCGFARAEKSGHCRKPRKPARLSATGTCTRCVAPMVHRPPRRARSRLKPTPASTTINGAGTSDCLSRLVLSHTSRIRIETAPMTAAPG